jgi:hypothetical protein
MRARHLVGLLVVLLASPGLGKGRSPERTGKLTRTAALNAVHAEIQHVDQLIGLGS